MRRPERLGKPGKWVLDFRERDDEEPDGYVSEGWKKVLGSGLVLKVATVDDEFMKKRRYRWFGTLGSADGDTLLVVTGGRYPTREKAMRGLETKAHWLLSELLKRLES